MAKTNPIGVRFDQDLLDSMKEDKLADSPQKVLNFLTEFYRTNREGLNLKEVIQSSRIFHKKKTGAKNAGKSVLGDIPKTSAGLTVPVSGNMVGFDSPVKYEEILKLVKNGESRQVVMAAVASNPGLNANQIDLIQRKITN